MAFSDYSFTGASFPSFPSSTMPLIGANGTGAPMTSANLMKMDTRLQRPDKPLIVKCTFDRSMRRITFASAQNCSWDLLRTRVEQCFSLYASSFIITYKDDDGEITDITSDDDLTEAIQYFHLGDDGVASTYGGSSYSGYSSRSSSSSSSRKITLRVDVQVDYDGPSLSDTASLNSLEEDKDRSASDSGSFVHVERGYGRELGEMDEDTMTISERPTIAGQADHQANGLPPKRGSGSVASTEMFSFLQRKDAAQPLRLQTNISSTTLLQPAQTPTETRKDNVFERLKAPESIGTLSPTSSVGKPQGGGTAQWLKEQSAQMIQSVLGGVPTPSDKALSVSDLEPNYQSSLSFATEDQEGRELKDKGEDGVEGDISGSLELELGRNGRGDWYYTCTGSTFSHSGDDHDPEPAHASTSRTSERQPTASTSARPPSMSTDATSIKEEDEEYFPPEANEDFKQYLPPSQSSDTLVGPDPTELTECSNCGAVLDTFRYVCATCGPRLPRVAGNDEGDGDPNRKGKERAVPPAPISASAGSVLCPPPLNKMLSPHTSQPAPNPPRPPSSPARSDYLPIPGSYSPQPPPHGHIIHSLWHHPSHSAGSLPGMLRPPAPPHHVGLGMHRLQPHPPVGTPHLPYHSCLHPPYPNGGPSNSFPPPTFPPPASPPPSFAPSFAPPSHPPPSPGTASVWPQAEGNAPSTSFSPPSTSSPSTHTGSSASNHNELLHKPLPRAPHLHTYPPTAAYTHHGPPSVTSSQPPYHSPRNPIQSPAQSSQRSGSSIVEGFELCTACMETAGIEHASESVTSGPEPTLSPSGGSPYAERSPYGVSSPGSLVADQAPPGSGVSVRSAGSGSWKRGGPRRKGQLRHAFKEKVWTSGGWTDVEHDNISKCTTCGSALSGERYKCATCLDMVVCRGCYSQIHEIHPIHAFLVVPEGKQDPVSGSPADDSSGERSLLHEGVKCSHCMMEIVGARFHCAICPSVDICQNCESAGFSGSLASSDGGHDSSHIMIKVPYPLSSDEVDAASRKAISLWTGRDAPNLQTSNSPSDGSRRPSTGAHSGGSNYADTVIGNPADSSRSGSHRMDHGMMCNGCGRPIIGVRYQCAGCPSPDGQGYSLCVDCEASSYQLHDPMHCFFKIPRPVDRKIQSEEALLPPIYILAAGESLEEIPVASRNDPRAYLQTIVHRVALCDRCIQRIVGEWFHCAYCAKDLCDACEVMDSHDASHLFVVFKSVVDMSVLRTLTDVENPQASSPLISYPVYTRPL